MKPDRIPEQREIMSKYGRRATKRKVQVRGQILPIQFKSSWKPIENQIQIQLADDTDAEIVLGGYHCQFASSTRTKPLNGDLLLKALDILEPGSTRRIGQAICLTAGCCKPQRVFRRISGRDGESKSGHG
jgi:hypothetical protein